MPHYAWAPIHLAERHGEGRDAELHRNVVKAGEEVSKDMFTDEDWQQLHEEGVIRKQKYPEGVQLGESVRTAVIRQANEAREAALGNTPNLDVDLTDDEENAGQTQESQGSRKPWNQ